MPKCWECQGAPLLSPVPGEHPCPCLSRCPLHAPAGSRGRGLPAPVPPARPPTQDRDSPFRSTWRGTGEGAEEAVSLRSSPGRTPISQTPG